MKVRDAEKRYKSATLGIWSALNAHGRGKVNLQKLCREHKVSVSFPSTLRERGFIKGKNGSSFWNPERDIPGDDIIAEMRVETLARMKVRNVPAAPPVVPPFSADDSVQVLLPLTSLSRQDELIASLVDLHRKTAALLGELGVAP